MGSLCQYINFNKVPRIESNVLDNQGSHRPQSKSSHCLFLIKLSCNIANLFIYVLPIHVLTKTAKLHGCNRDHMAQKVQKFTKRITGNATNNSMHRKLTTSVKWINSLKTINFKIFNSSITMKGIKFIVKNLAKKVFLGPDDFTENSTKHLKEKNITLILHNLF